MGIHEDHFGISFPELDDPAFWGEIASQTNVLPDLPQDGGYSYLQEDQIRRANGEPLLLPAPLLSYTQATMELDDPTFWSEIASQVNVFEPFGSGKPPRYPSYMGQRPEPLMLPGSIALSHPGGSEEAGERAKQKELQALLLPILLIVLAALIMLTTVLHPTASRSSFNDTTPEVAGTWNVHCQKATPLLTGGPSSIVGKATLDTDFINKVLDAYHSPMAGEGQLFTDVSQYCGLDPAFVLAFYMHESSFGNSGEARESLSPGNLRCIPHVQCQDGYAWFNSWQDGLMVQCRLLRNLYVDTWGLSTPEQIIPRYAPASDHNNEAGYEHALEHAVDTWRLHIVVVS